MKILITGGAGYIGSHIGIELLNNGYDIIIIDNYCNSDRNVIRIMQQIAGKSFLSYDCDLRDKHQMEMVFRENAISAVIHCAGLKCVPESIANPIPYYQNNIGGTLNLLECMKRYGVYKIVFSSSATVYGLNNPVPYKEEMLLSATNPYGWTKIMIEQILKDFTTAEKDMKAAILRYFNPIGAHPSGLIGEKPEGIPNNLMPYLCQAAAGKLPSIKICGTDYRTADGTGVRDYIHVCDLVKGHVKALEKLDFLTGTEIYNLGTGKGSSVLKLITTFETVNGIKLKREISKRRPGDIDESYADVSKADKELGWKTELSLEDMCRDSWNYIKKNYAVSTE
ncbi:UDP-glucose 4-epimerase GalE [Anaerocolumna sp. MB42-C2]|uniref:UDP-glucose 4-epimerase GalE n=1 Tax=Anaerocolumna sp. MB42-C2 TaxID=3070997 RepID=UPI0027DEEDDB|nr:UDP-glucose 4-epimerase GalE [Anaerocolumna sp. MB42-C2]WMJ86264.1 UDP-glucose 4-epimerase GalE [Anaerocolumna sp. MB42-C2]